MGSKTLSYLYSKVANRFAKIIYIFLYIITILFIYGWTIGGGSGSYKDFFVAFMIAAILFEAIKRAFYYITLGTIKPKQ